MTLLFPSFTEALCRSPDDNRFSAVGSDPAFLPLAGRSILLVEDELVVAMDLQYALEDVGAKVIGPFDRLPKAESAVNDATLSVDAAILDLDLHGAETFPVAEALEARGIPFVLHTGHGEVDVLNARFPNAPVCRKPSMNDDLLRALSGLLSKKT